MQLLPKWVLTNPLPSRYDMESGTATDMAAKVYGAMEELIKEYNSFADAWNTKMEEFTAQTEEQYNLFAMDMRQEFQDFIDVIDIKYQEQNRILTEAVNSMDAIANEAINKAIASGKITVSERYEPETESLYIVAGGGI